MGSEFAKSIEDAQRLPDRPDDVDGGLPNPFLGTDPMDLVSRVLTRDPDQIPNGVNYDYTYKCARLLIGQVLSGSNNGMPTYDDVDDSDRLTEIMNKTLQAKAVLFKKETSFLKDGTIVIWLEWGEPQTLKKAASKVLSIAELMSPESPQVGDDSEDEKPNNDDMPEDEYPDGL
mgnify:CR=1 FL=1